MNGDLRQHSKGNWNHENTIEGINAGSLQRIADATEKMALNYSKLIEERDNYKKWYYEKMQRVDRCYRQMTAYRGVITKLKNKLNQK